MADNTVVHMGENSPEHVAYRLMGHIMGVEGKTFARDAGRGFATADRKYTLDLYAECLRATTGKRAKPPQE